MEILHGETGCIPRNSGMYDFGANCYAILLWLQLSYRLGSCRNCIAFGSFPHWADKELGTLPGPKGRMLSTAFSLQLILKHVSPKYSNIPEIMVIIEMFTIVLKLHEEYNKLHEGSKESAKPCLLHTKLLVRTCNLCH